MKLFNFKNFSLNNYLQPELAYFVAFSPLFNLFALVKFEHNSILYFGQLICLFYMVLTPGLFLLPFLTHKKLPFGLGMVFSTAIGVFSLMFVGLILNTVLPWFGILHPLSKLPLLIAFDVVITILFALNSIYNKHFILHLPKFDSFNATLIFSSLFIPLLSCMGAISLNNGGSGSYTVIGLVMIFIITLISLFKSEKVNSDTYPVLLYVFALSFLLMNAMRGWFVSGHDILLEYHVFDLAKNYEAWKMYLYQDPYNACLSLTILPTYLYKLLHLNEYYVYKFFIHFIGATPVVVVYYLTKEYVKEKLAFLVAILYITFPTYMVDMAFLNRQGIAFMFFGLVLYNLLNNELFGKKNRLLVLFLFGTGMIFSHYSTSYIAIPTLIGAYIINIFIRYVVSLDGPFWLVKITDKMKNKEVFDMPSQIPLVFVTGLLAIMIVWSTFVTKTSGSFVETIKQIAVSLKDPFSLDEQSGPARYSLVKGEQQSPEELLKQFVKENIKEHNVVQKQSEFYPLASTQKYPAYPVPEKIAPLTDYGLKVQAKISFTLNDLYINIKQTYAKILQVFLMLGLFGIVFGISFKNLVEKNVSSEYLALSFSALGVIVAQTILPSFAINYGLLRLFQQNLFFFALPIVLGLSVIFLPFTRQYDKRVNLLGVLLMTFFLFLSGVIPQLTGGTRALMHLNNSGLYYDSYLVHAEEVSSAKWISQYSGSKLPVQAAHFSDIKMIAYGKIAPYIELLPETTKRKSFVYLNYDNVKTSNILEIVYGEVIYYRFPMEFLKANKNKIYDNGGSQIFR